MMPHIVLPYKGQGLQVQGDNAQITIYGGWERAFYKLTAQLQIPQFLL